MTDYVTADEVKNHLPDPAWGAKYDAILGDLVTRASRLIDTETREKSGGYAVSADSTVYMDGTGTAELLLSMNPTVRFLAQAPTEIAISEDGKIGAGDYTVLATTDFFALPYNAPDYGEPYRELVLDVRNGDHARWPAFPRSVRIEGRIGWSVTVPTEIKEAAIIQVVRWLKRAQQSFQDTGAIVELGQLRYTKELDPEVARTVRAFALNKMTV